MPFRSKNAKGQVAVEFDVLFDVIKGDLTFHLGLPTLVAIVANLDLN